MLRFKPLQVLLVEDNPDDVAITKRAFSRSALVCRLIVARDGQEVLDMLLGASPDDLVCPDLILLDVNLPRMNGLKVLKQIRSSNELSMIPVVMLTASARHEDVEESYRLGANSYIQKPMLFAALKRSLDVLGQYWFEVATLPSPPVV